jgi:hypothetical protein
VGRNLWTVATDGGYFMALKGRQNKLPTKEQDQVVDFLKAAVLKPAHGVETEKLKAWAGSAPESRAFNWEDVDEAHWGVMFDVCLDRRRLACILENLPFGMVQVWDASKTLGVAGIGLEAKGWRGYLAGLKDGPEPGVTKFEFRKVGPVTGIDLMSELSQE